MAWRRPGNGFECLKPGLTVDSSLLMPLAPLNKLHQLTCIFHPKGTAKLLPLGTTLMVLIRFCMVFLGRVECHDGLRLPWDKHQALDLLVARDLPAVTHQRQINAGTNLIFI